MSGARSSASTALRASIAVVLTAAVGAQQRHWAFAPLPREVAVPEVRDAAWCRNDVDRFVLARLEAAGVAPAPRADDATWLRRASLTLTGLPADERDRSAFAADAGDDAAYARAARRMLAGDRYAEHMTSHWLDVARYADTYGYQSDVARPVWPWRDQVIRAFRDNLPFDEFATWQLAGDLLPDATREQRLMTAFQRLHRMTNEGGSVEEEMRLEYVADRTETFATAFLGLTVGCARCHDHKFDPVSIGEYYALSSFFDDVDESGLYSHFTNATPTPTLSLPSDEQRAAVAEAAAKVRALEGEIERLEAAPNLDFAAWTAGDAREAAPPVGRFAFESLADQALTNDAAGGPAGRVYDGPALVAGRVGKALSFSGDNGAKLPKVADFDRHQPFSFSFWLRVPARYERAVVLHRSRAWTDAGSRGYELLVEEGRLSFALVHFWPGNAVRVRAREALPVDRWTHVGVAYDGSSRAGGMSVYVDGARAETDVVRDCLTRTITGGGADALTLAERFRDRGLKGGAIDELLVFDRELTAWEVAGLAGVAPPSDQRDVRSYYLRAIDEAYRAKLAELVAARRELGALQDAPREIMVMRDLPEPRATFVRLRGAYDRPGAAVKPGVPACLPPLPTGPANRLTLARWLVHPDHPLTARVAVNRIWQMHFGRGLVVTAEDFGTQGAAPTHPRLLDWLARRFVESGWDVKALHELIVTSATFAQRSRAPADARRRDPDNALLARGPRFQLSAEVLRDQALWAGGLLVERVGGPPVYPYQPAGLWQEKSGKVYRPSKGDGLYRRSLYTFWKRTSPPPAMMLLGASKRDVCVMRRPRATTPLQALLLMNDPQHVEAARVFAERLLQDGGGEGLVSAAFSRMTGRLPDLREAGVLRAALREHRESFAADPDRARALVAVGERAPHEGLDPVDVAAATMVVQTILNSDEVVRLR